MSSLLNRELHSSSEMGGFGPNAIEFVRGEQLELRARRHEGRHHALQTMFSIRLYVSGRSTASQSLEAINLDLQSIISAAGSAFSSGSHLLSSLIVSSCSALSAKLCHSLGSES